MLNIHNEYFENVLGALNIQFGLWIFSQVVGLRWIQNRMQNVQTEFPLCGPNPGPTAPPLWPRTGDRQATARKDKGRWILRLMCSPRQRAKMVEARSNMVGHGKSWTTEALATSDRQGEERFQVLGGVRCGEREPGRPQAPSAVQHG